MKIITKVEFISALEGKPSIFAGLESKKAIDAESMQSVVDYYFNDPKVLHETRTAKRYGRGLMFTGGSALDVYDDGDNIRTCYLYSFSNCNVYAIENSYSSLYDGIIYKTCYYITF